MQTCGYRVGEWLVNPKQNLIQQADITRHIDHKSMQVLLVLIEHAGTQVTKQQLFDKVWQDKAVTDDILSVAISHIRKALGDNARSPSYIKTLPGVGYCLIAQVSPLEQIAVEKNALNLPRVSKYKITALLLALILVCGSTFWLFNLAKLSVSSSFNVEQNHQSIAVLPFKEYGREQSLGYFSEGLADVILDKLSRVPELTVIDRNSSFIFREQQQSSKEIGQQLGVNYLLQGSIQWQQKDVRIVVQLINTLTGSQLWSKTFDRHSEQIFNVQDEISKVIVQQLSPSYGGAITDSLKVSETAWELYLLGNFYWQQRTADSLTKAIDYFKQVIELEPLFTKAYVKLANAYQFQRAYGNRSLSEVKMKAWPLLRKALEIAPDMGAAYASIGLLQTDEALAVKGTPKEQVLLEQAEEAFRQALILGSQEFETFHWYARLLHLAGKIEQAAQYFDKAKRLNPLSPALYRSMSFNLQALGKEDSAQRMYHRANELSDKQSIAQMYNLTLLRFNDTVAKQLIPWIKSKTTQELVDSFWISPLYVGLVYLNVGDEQEAHYWFTLVGEMSSTEEDERQWLRAVHASTSGDKNEVLKAITEIAELYPENMSHQSLLAMAALHAGQKEMTNNILQYIYPVLAKHQMPELNGDNYRDLLNYALAQRASTPEQAEEQLLEIERFLQQQPLYSKAQSLMASAEVNCLLGRHSIALAYLEKALDAGWRQDLTKEWWLLKDNPYLTAIHQKPKFIALVNRLTKNNTSF